MGILKFKFEKLVVLGIPKTLLLKCFTIELLTLQWGLSRDRVPTSPMDCHHDVPHLNGHILRVLPPFSEIYQDPIVGIFGSIYIYIQFVSPFISHWYPVCVPFKWPYFLSHRQEPPMGLLLQHRIVEQKNPPILAQKNMTPKTLVNTAWIFGWHLAMRQIGGQRNQGRGVQIHRFVALPQPSGSNVAHDDMGLSDMFKRKTSEFHG